MCIPRRSFEKLRRLASAAEAEEHPECQITEDAAGSHRAKWHPAQDFISDPVNLEQDDELNAIRKQSRDAFLQASEDGNLMRAPLGGSGCFISGWFEWN